MHCTLLRERRSETRGRVSEAETGPFKGYLALLHVPERDQLRHTDQASEVTQRGRLEPLPIIHVRHEIPGVLLHVAGNLLALDVIGRNRPFAAERLVLLVSRPAEPALFPIGGMAGERDGIAEGVDRARGE